jgi:P27 family predicted phage terminase small subunit
MPPRKKPSAINAIHGNPSKRPLNKTEPKPPAGAVCPAWIGKEGKKEWNRLIKTYEGIELITAGDQSALAIHCHNWDRWVEAEKIVTEEGLMVEEPLQNKAGDIVGYKKKRHPMSIEAIHRQAAVMRSGAAFGFTPSDRAKIHLPEGAEVPDDNDGDDGL